MKSNSGEVVEEVVLKYESVLSMLADGIKEGTLRDKLLVNPLEPLFRVR